MRSNIWQLQFYIPLNQCVAVLMDFNLDLSFDSGSDKWFWEKLKGDCEGIIQNLRENVLKYIQIKNWTSARLHPLTPSYFISLHKCHIMLYLSTQLSLKTPGFCSAVVFTASSSPLMTAARGRPSRDYQLIPHHMIWVWAIFGLLD